MDMDISLVELLATDEPQYSLIHKSCFIRQRSLSVLMATTLGLSRMLGGSMFASNASITASLQQVGLATTEMARKTMEAADSTLVIVGSPFTISLPGINTMLGEAYVASVLCMALITLSISSYQTWNRRTSLEQFAQTHGCARTPKALPMRFMASLRNKIHLLSHHHGDLLDDVFAEKYRSFGETHALYDSSGFARVVHTIDPVNVNAMLATRSQDYRGPKNRKAILWPLAQDGVLATEGAQWLYHRKTVQRALSKGAKQTAHIEAEVQLLFRAIGSVDAQGWTNEVDLLDLFFRMALDLSIQHLFGATANAQITGIQERERLTAMVQYDLVPAQRKSGLPTYNEAYEIVRNTLSRRSKLGSKYWMADSLEVMLAVRSDIVLLSR